MTDIKAAAAKIAEEVAKNCGSVPQLTFPHIYLGLEEFAKSLAAHQAAPQQAQAPGWQLVPVEPTPEVLEALFRNERDPRAAWAEALRAAASQQGAANGR